jgi:hypothetical protein
MARHRRPRLTVIVLLAIPLWVAGCGQGAAPKIAVESPVATVRSWFGAINAGDKPLAVAHFVPADQPMMDWSDFGSVRFQDLVCNSLTQTTNAALVRCSFEVPNPPPDLAGDTFWTVSLSRQQSNGPWLISDYGTG